MKLIEKIKTERLFFCGSMGTMLEPVLMQGEMPELINITNPAFIKKIHRAYIDAGANIIKTNTFGANRLKLANVGFSVDVVVKAALGAAKDAAAGKAHVAMSVGSLGKMIQPVGDMPLDEAAEIFAEAIVAGAKAGAEMILIETMGDTCEIKAAMLAAKENCNLPVAVTFTLDGQGKLFTGGDILTAVSLIEDMDADLIGLNCGFGVEQSLPQLRELFEHTNLPIIFNPNAGLPQLIEGKTVFNTTPTEFTGYMQQAAPYAAIMGGCCGTTPEYISEMIKSCSSAELQKKSPIERQIVSSYNKAVVLNECTVFGEPIKPTASIQDDVLDSVDDGAEVIVLDINGYDADASDMLRSVQEVTNVPVAVIADEEIVNNRHYVGKLYNYRVGD